MIRTPSLRTLELFSTLMLTRSLTDTAKRIGISQPAASLALKELEVQTGLSLFTRSKQRLTPTPQAEALLPHVERLLAQADTVQQRIGMLQDTSASTLRIACIPSFGSTLLPQTISGFKRRQPRVQLRVDVQPYSRVLDLIRMQATDIGFSYTAETFETTEEPLFKATLSCVMAKGHPLAAKKVIRHEDLAGHTTMVATQSYIPIPAEVLAALREEDGPAPLRVMEVNHVFSAMALARHGVGVALLNPMLLLSGHAGGLVGRPFKPDISLTLGVMRAAPPDSSSIIPLLIEQARLAARDGVKRLRAFGIKAEAA